MTEPQGQLVPMYDDEPADESSWDAFWAERKPTRTTVIRGVTVRIPTGITIGYREEVRQRLDARGQGAFAAIAMEILRAPDGTIIPDLWDRWRAAGMELDELEALILWAMARGSGNPISFAEAADQVAARAAADEGKAQPSTRTPSSASTGGRSKPASARRTGSSRKTSPA